MIGALAALLLAAAPVQASKSLDGFETICVSTAAEMMAADEAATASGWSWFEDPQPDPEGDFFEYYGRSDDPLALLVLGIQGDDITLSSCELSSNEGFETLVNAIDARLGFEAQLADGETGLGWAFTRDGQRMTPISGAGEIDLRTLVRPDRPVHLIVLNTDADRRYVTYKRLSDLSPDAQPAASKP